MAKAETQTKDAKPRTIEEAQHQLYDAVNAHAQVGNHGWLEEGLVFAASTGVGIGVGLGIQHALKGKKALAKTAAVGTAIISALGMEQVIGLVQRLRDNVNAARIESRIEGLVKELESGELPSAMAQAYQHNREEETKSPGMQS